ncbi:hypothetical protein GGI22_004476 [Coemansia erecta]|nr:hypothetical protein GGI22_004476 [Coemansia erecta]
MVALLMVAFFALLARRVDHIWSTPFALVFMPLWIVDALVVAGIVWFYAKGHALFGSHGDGQPDAERANEYGDDDSVVDADGPGDRDDASCDVARPSSSSYGSTAATPPASRPTDGSGADGPSSADHAASPPATSKTPLLAATATNNGDGSSGRANSSARRYNSRLKRRRLRQVRSHAEALFRCIATPAPAVYLSLLFVFQILIVLRLDHHISLSVWRIVSPWLGIEVVHFILLTLHFIESVCLAAEQAARTRATADNSSNTEDRSGSSALRLKHIVVMAADTYWWLAIRVSLALLISSKIDPQGMAHAWSWALVFCPSYLPFVRWTLMLCVLRQRLRAMGEAEIAQNERAIFGAYVAVIVLTCSFLYSFVALLVWKLSLPQAVRMALVLVPVFIAMSLCCCFCSCVSLCLSYGISATLDEEQRVEAGGASSADRSNARASSSLSSAENNGASGMLVPANRRIE